MMTHYSKLTRARLIAIEAISLWIELLQLEAAFRVVGMPILWMGEYSQRVDSTSKDVTVILTINLSWMHIPEWVDWQLSLKFDSRFTHFLINHTDGKYSIFAIFIFQLNWNSHFDHFPNVLLGFLSMMHPNHDMHNLSACVCFCAKIT